jgi:hypothetical protein
MFFGYGKCAAHVAFLSLLFLFHSSRSLKLPPTIVIYNKLNDAFTLLAHFYY